MIAHPMPTLKLLNYQLNKFKVSATTLADMSAESVIFPKEW
ncbi:hypothetical protein SOHN41_03992 [Shewanella sp. HN-41]|nr:hypothetical protein SOHN41_03992 [Shewanella sp. HN-41]